MVSLYSALFPRLSFRVLEMAGFLTFSWKLAFPTFRQWLLVEFPIMEITVAGTVQVFHLIPFYAKVEHLSITKSAANLHIFCISCKLFRLFFWLIR